MIHIPNYSIGEAAHMLHLPKSTAHNWILNGKLFTQVSEANYLSFTNLVELYALKILSKKYRLNITWLKSIINTGSLSLIFKDSTDFLVIYPKPSYIKQVIKKDITLYSEQVDYTNNYVTRLYPNINKKIMIDPHISFGAPVLTNTGIPTLILKQRFLSGDTVNSLAYDYDCSREMIESALRYEDCIINVDR